MATVFGNIKTRNVDVKTLNNSSGYLFLGAGGGMPTITNNTPWRQIPFDGTSAADTADTVCLTQTGVPGHVNILEAGYYEIHVDVGVIQNSGTQELMMCGLSTSLTQPVPPANSFLPNAEFGMYTRFNPAGGALGNPRIASGSLVYAGNFAASTPLTLWIRSVTGPCSVTVHAPGTRMFVRRLL